MKTPNRDAALRIMGQRPNRERALALMADSTCRVTIRGEINEGMARYVKQQLAARPHAGTLEVTIDSPGGDIPSAFAIFDAIHGHSAATKITIAETECSSAAMLVFAAGDVRRMSADCNALLHLAALEPDASRGRWTARRYDNAAKRLATIDTGVAATISSRCGCDTENVLREMQTERATPVSRLKALAIVTEILP